MMKIVCALLGVSFFFTTAFAENYIVKLKAGVSATEFEKSNNVKLERIHPQFDYYRATPLSSGSQKRMRKTLRGATFNIPDHPVKMRSKPNIDPKTFLQWNYLFEQNKMGINVVNSWNEFGFQSNDNKNTIVAAVVDSGLHEHKDFAQNIWTNTREIPDNNKDDDENGYVDDHRIWRSGTSTYSYLYTEPFYPHGTEVAGLIAANTFNESGEASGMTGVAPNAKLMLVDMPPLGAPVDIAGNHSAENIILHRLNETLTTSQAVEAYLYVLAQKQLWLNTDGKEGANVVVVNSSFGIDRAKCSDPQFRIWNDLYNMLGYAGILSVVATTNEELDVDRFGDIPTTCESQFLITVTNSVSNGERSAKRLNPQPGESTFQAGEELYGSGYGVKNVDIAAPGTNIVVPFYFYLSIDIVDPEMGPLSAGEHHDYRSEIGTSYSAPQVAGAVAYLHGIAPENFKKRLEQNQGLAVQDLRAIILKTATQIPSMKNEVASGGVLNVHEAAKLLMQITPPLPPPNLQVPAEN